jgi:hypothetical protein
MPSLPNDVEYFGQQFMVDETGEFIRSEPRLLLNSTNFSIDEIITRVYALDGIVIPAHVERKSYGLLPSLGLIADEWHLLALEVSRQTSMAQAAAAFPALRKYPIIQGGDVHRLDEFLGTTMFDLDSPTVMEIRMAFLNIAGRSVRVESKINS